MSQLFKNVLIILTVIVLVAIGYYMLKERGSNSLSLNNADAISDQLLTQTQVFIERRNQLESISFDFEIFNNPNFSSLVSYSGDVPEQVVGKSNIFDTVSNIQTDNQPSH